MATQCREQQRKRKNKIATIRAYAMLAVVFMIGSVSGFFIGRVSAPEVVKTETITLTDTVEVPMYESDKLPDNAEVFLYDVPLSEHLQRYIYEICADKNVPVTLVMAMIDYESQFNAEAISPTEDYGLMQINSVNHDWLEAEHRCADMLNPYQNVYCGITIISSYLEKYEGDYGKALMAYNMGDYGARKAWNDGITSTKYSTSVLELMAYYEEVSNATGN